MKLKRGVAAVDWERLKRMVWGLGNEVVLKSDLEEDGEGEEEEGMNGWEKEEELERRLPSFSWRQSAQMPPVLRKG